MRGHLAMSHTFLKKRLTKKKKTTSKRWYTARRRRQRGGRFHIESIPEELESRTIVTMRPDSREEDSIPLTGRLPVIRKLLEQ
jgi:hypothetical protein